MVWFGLDEDTVFELLWFHGCVLPGISFVCCSLVLRHSYFDLLDIWYAIGRTNNFSVLNKDHFHYFITATDQNTPKRQFATKILAVQHFISVHNTIVSIHLMCLVSLVILFILLSELVFRIYFTGFIVKIDLCGASRPLLRMLEGLFVTKVAQDSWTFHHGFEVRDTYLVV